MGHALPSVFDTSPNHLGDAAKFLGLTCEACHDTSSSTYGPWPEASTNTAMSPVVSALIVGVDFSDTEAMILLRGAIEDSSINGIAQSKTRLVKCTSELNWL